MKYGLTDISYQKIKNVIEKYSEYEFIVFGSRARGDYKNNSDIDIGSEEVEFPVCLSIVADHVVVLFVCNVRHVG